MSNIFDRHWKRYDAWYDKHKFAYLSEIAAIKKVLPEKRKGLEIGVGTGRFAELLGVEHGIDPSEKMLEIAKSRGVKTYVGKGESLPFKDDEFDFVLIVITLCFVDNPSQVIKESRRVLKSNGKLIIGIVDRDSHLGKFYQKEKKQGHKFYKKANFYSTSEVIKLLKKHGFNRIVTFQTIFQPLEKIKEIKQPKESFGKGGFVVICGKKI